MEQRPAAAEPEPRGVVGESLAEVERLDRAERAIRVPPLQTSLVVHALPSLHGRLLLACWQPSAASQKSSVHGLPSSQSSGLPATHVPP